MSFSSWRLCTTATRYESTKYLSFFEKSKYFHSRACAAQRMSLTVLAWRRAVQSGLYLSQERRDVTALSFLDSGCASANRRSGPDVVVWKGKAEGWF